MNEVQSSTDDMAKGIKTVRLHSAQWDLYIAGDQRCRGLFQSKGK